MSTWWTKVGEKIERHDGREGEVRAAFALTLAGLMGAELTTMGLFKTDPANHADAINELPARLVRAQQQHPRRRR